MPAPVLVDTPVAVPGQGNAIVADYTSWDVRAGDLLLMAGRSQGTVSAEISPMPDGWFRGGLNGSVGVGDRFQGLFFHPTPTAPASPIVSTFPGVSGGGNSRIMSALGIIRGADLSDWNSGGLKYQASETIASVAALKVPYLLIAIWAAEFTAGISVIPTVVPSNLTIRAIYQTKGGSPAAVIPNSDTTGSRTGIIIATQTVEAGGSATVPAMTMGWGGAPSAVKSASTMIHGLTTPPRPGLLVKKGDGSPSRMTYKNRSGQRVTPRYVHIWRKGFNDVEAYLAKKGATSLHRGGSATLPEYSERGYDMGVRHGFGTLEFSCAFSSDLILFGNGDQYLDRMVGGTGSIDAATMPWSTINANYQNRLRPVALGKYQPLYRLEEFLTKYTPHHVVQVDPKFGHATPARVAAMIDLCLAIGGPDKVIIKFDSPLGNNILVNAAHAAGFIAMNYWGTELDKLTPAYGSDKWDLIGIRYDTTQANYDLALGLNKPVWAAVIPDQVGYDLAATRGADLMMVTNVETIKSVQ